MSHIRYSPQNYMTVFVELIDVVDGGVESEVQSGSCVDPYLSNEASAGGEEGEEGGEGGEGALCAANQVDIVPDSTTIHSDSTEVTSTLQRQGFV